VHNIQIQLTDESIKNAVREMRTYAAWVARKEAELRLKLASIGATAASIRFSRAIYNGSNDITVRVDSTGSVAVIYAEGQSVAFIEFGAGERYGYGHPKAAELGVGPGTWPEGKGHWDDPKGWWYASGKHSYGNPPAMAMYFAYREMVENLTQIAREVFAT
jgi:hypothetical protein